MLAGVSEKRELVELVMNSNDSTEADAATIQANREKEMESGGILFTSTEDALASRSRSYESSYLPHPPLPPLSPLPLTDERWHCSIGVHVSARPLALLFEVYT